MKCATGVVRTLSDIETAEEPGTYWSSLCVSDVQWNVPGTHQLSSLRSSIWLWRCVWTTVLVFHHDVSHDCQPSDHQKSLHILRTLLHYRDSTTNHTKLYTVATLPDIMQTSSIVTGPWHMWRHADQGAGEPLWGRPEENLGGIQGHVWCQPPGRHNGKTFWCIWISKMTRTVSIEGQSICPEHLFLCFTERH